MLLRETGIAHIHNLEEQFVIECNLDILPTQYAHIHLHIFIGFPCLLCCNCFRLLYRFDYLLLLICISIFNVTNL